MQEMSVRRFEPDDRAQELRIGSDEGGGQQAGLDQPVLAIDVGKHPLEQFGPLDEAGGNRGPFRLVDQHGNVRKRPAALGILLAVGAIEDPGIAQIPVCACEAVGKIRLVHAAERRKQPLPYRPNVAARVEHFVGDARQGAIAKGRAALDSAHLFRPCGLLLRHSNPCRTPRSRNIIG